MNHREMPKWWNHMPASQIKSLIGDDIWNQYFKFCVIRNPYDRVVSFFFWEMRQDGKPDWELFTLPKSQLQERFENWLVNAQIPDDRDKYMINGTICMDDFIRYEDLPSDIRRFVANWASILIAASFPLSSGSIALRMLLHRCFIQS